MKLFDKWSAKALLFIISGAIVIGCDRNIGVTPTSVVVPALPTNTFTTIPVNTSTATATSTATGTNTSTATATNTNLPGNTNTFTSTATNTTTYTSTYTPTSTFTVPPGSTNTFTFTITNTPTATFTITQTPTPTNCTAPSAVNANFETGLGCWQDNPANAAFVTAFGANGVNPHTGSQSLQVAINNTSVATQNIEAWLNFTTPQNLTGQEMVAYVWVDASLTSSAYSSGLQVFDQSPSWNSAPWITLNNAPPDNTGAWVPVTIVFGANGDNAANVSSVGFQLTGVPAGATGNMYIDDIQFIPAPFTATPTFTLPGATNTFTDTPTATATGTPTSTPTVCTVAASFQPGYNFNSGLQCWSFNPPLGPGNYVTSFSANSNNLHNGNQSIQAVINNTNAATSNEQIWLSFSTPQNLTGYEMIVYVWVDSSLTGPLYTSGIQPFDGSPSFQSQYINAGPPSTNVNAWIPVTFVFGAQADVASTVSNFGIQLTGIPAGATGNFYIADVQVIPVPVVSPQWTYEDGTTQQWSYVGASSGTASVAVTTLASISPTNPSVDTSTYGFAINIPAGALTNSNNDFQAECNSTSGSPVIGTSMNWTTLNFHSVTVKYWLSTSVGSYSSTLYPYVRAGTTPNTYGGTYTGTWINNCGTTACPYVADNTWQTVTFTPSGPNWTTDETDVLAVGVDINVSANAAFPGGAYIIDDILLQ